MRLAHSGPMNDGEQRFPTNLNARHVQNEQAVLTHQSSKQDTQPQLEWLGCAAKPHLTPHLSGHI